MIQTVYDFTKGPRRGVFKMGMSDDLRAILRSVELENPALAFSESARVGAYNDMDDASYADGLSSVKALSSCWSFATDMSPDRKSVNVLAVVSNMARLICEQDARIRSLERSRDSRNVMLQFLFRWDVDSKAWRPYLDLDGLDGVVFESVYVRNPVSCFRALIDGISDGTFEDPTGGAEGALDVPESVRILASAWESVMPSSGFPRIEEIISLKRFVSCVPHWAGMCRHQDLAVSSDAQVSMAEAVAIASGCAESLPSDVLADDDGIPVIDCGDE